MASEHHRLETPETVPIVASTHDPVEYELAMRPWELACRPRQAGDFRHQVTGIKSTNFTIYRERYNLASEMQGFSPANMLTIGIPLDYEACPVFWKTSWSKDTMPASLPGPLDALMSSGHSQLIVLISIEFLQRVLPEDSHVRLIKAVQSRCFALPPEVISSFSRWGNALLGTVRQDPNRFDRPVVTETISQQLVDWLLHFGACLPPPGSMSSLSKRKAGLARSLEFLRQQESPRISIADLCRVSGISERSLRYAFREEFGISPMDFMRRRRMHAARQMLYCAKPGQTTIAKIAAEQGFYEFGRFAADYRRYFGTRPSQTLRQQAHPDWSAYRNLEVDNQSS